MFLLKNRDFSVLLSGQLLSQLGNNLFMLALPWYVYVSSGSKGALALTGLFLSIPGVVGLLSGVYVDRWNKRTTMIVSDLIRCLLSALIAWLAYKGHFVFIVIALVLIMQFTGTFFAPAESALVPIVVGDEQMTAASGINQSSSAIAQLAGSFGGGALLGLLGAPLLFLYNAVSFAISVLSLGFLRVKETRRREKHQQSFRRELIEGWKFIRSSRLIQYLVFASLIANFGLAAVDITMTAWVKGPMHGSALSLGIVNGTFFIGVLFGGFTLGWVTKLFHVKTVIQFGLILAGVGMCLTGAWANLYWNSAVWLGSGVVISFMNGSLGAYMVQLVPPNLRGRVFGTLGALSVLAAPLGIALFGSLMLSVRLSTLFIAMGILAAIGGLIFFLPSAREATSSVSDAAATTTSDSI
jgi:MFS transporter, DHA3 family, macrolide efflux protein